MNRQPNLILHGTEFSTPAVYAWVREDTWLYVGITAQGVNRLGRHNIIGKADNLNSDDKILIWYMNSATWAELELLEKELIIKHKPRYNGIKGGKPGAKQVVKCIVCDRLFMQKTTWQKFCSRPCQQGTPRQETAEYTLDLDIEDLDEKNIAKSENNP